MARKEVIDAKLLLVNVGKAKRQKEIKLAPISEGLINAIKIPILPTSHLSVLIPGNINPSFSLTFTEFARLFRSAQPQLRIRDPALDPVDDAHLYPDPRAGS